MRIPTLLFCLFLCTCVRAQETPMTYENASGDVHLTGPIQLADLQVGPYAEWYAENASKTPEIKESAWRNQLNNTRVTIYLGTWCGDSREWVPQFVSLWQTLGLSTDQLDFVALYDGEERYKQGPNGEERGRQVHRVPTFIFERDGEEFARIVERPRTDLLTDVAQIALGYPPEAQYAAANYLFEKLEAEPLDSINANLRTHFRAIRRKISSPYELNTLGYVLLRSGRTDEAELVFRINAFVFKHMPYVLDSYAEVLQLKGKNAEALSLLDHILDITPDDERVAELAGNLRKKVDRPE